jgi:hypothetical protein
MLFVLWVAKYNKEGEGRDKKGAKNKIRASRISRKMLVFTLPSSRSTPTGAGVYHNPQNQEWLSICTNVDM